MSQLFSEQLAFSVARFRSYDKGKEYFEDDCVKKIWQEGEKYKAIVQGNNTYNVSLKFEDEVLTYDCSCPFELEGACKHVVAAILAFASDKKISSVVGKKKESKNILDIKKLLSKITDSQKDIFLERILNKKPIFVEDLKIFLQGQQQSPVTIENYKTLFKNKLDELDLKELVQIWYQEGDDYYEDQYDFSTERLDDLVDEFIDKGEKYEENQNYAEALKIYQAVFEALFEKQQSLQDDVSDLSDWFAQEMEKAIDFYTRVLAKTNNKNLKEIGIRFLSIIFQNTSPYINKELLLKGLKQTIINKEEAKFTQDGLDFKTENNLSVEESSLLAFLFFLSGDWRAFENITLKNLKTNPSLTLDLLRYYKTNNQKDKIIKISETVLKSLMNKKEDDSIYSDLSFDYKEVEIQIRRFLKETYSDKEDYFFLVANLERLFLITGSLSDYEELAKKYHDKSEKEKFLEVVKKYFNNEYKVKNIFKVLKLENQKHEILVLINKFPQAECFTDMIIYARVEFPQECFHAYKSKIQNILMEAKVEKYIEAVYHLKKMKEIGLNKEFNNYVDSIKTNYWRRRKLMEELQNNQL